MKGIYKLTELPKLDGVSRLTDVEVLKDLRELLRVNDDDTDSDCSICSADILRSKYPVKPRSGLKLVNRDSSVINGKISTDFSEIDGVDIEESLAFVRQTTKNNSYLMDLEKKRENFEIIHQAFEKLNKNDITQSEEENYIRTLQGLYLRTLRLQSVYSRHNAMLSEIHASMKDRSEREKQLARAYAKLSSLNNVGYSVDKQTEYLRVAISETGEQIMLFVGQSISTPFGKGVLCQIFPLEQKVEIKLNFGVMFAALGRVVCWSRGSSLDCHSDSALCRFYESDVRCALLSSAGTHGLASPSHALLSAALEEPDETDEDEILSGSDDESLEGGERESVSESADLIAESLATLSGAAATAVAVDKSVFPLPADNTSTSRRFLMNRLSIARQDTDAFSSEHLRKVLPMSFAPPGSLPVQMLSLKRKQESEAAHVSLDLSALQDCQSHAQGASTSLAWRGDVHQLRSSLQSLGDQIRQLESENLAEVTKVNHCRSVGATLSSEISATRLGMFTRRIIHRNNLSTQGMALSTVSKSADSQCTEGSGGVPVNVDLSHADSETSHFKSFKASGVAKSVSGGTDVLSEGGRDHAERNSGKRSAGGAEADESEDDITSSQADKAAPKRKIAKRPRRY